MNPKKELHPHHPHHRALDPTSNLLRINIRHRFSTRANITGVLWTTHDVPGDMTLGRLFERHIKSVLIPNQTFILQQINRHFEAIPGTGVFVWNELNTTKIADTNWLFDDGEVWLGCYVPSAIA